MRALPRRGDQFVGTMRTRDQYRERSSELADDFDGALAGSWAARWTRRTFTIGLDLAKNVFQVHGIDANEKVVVRKQLRRSQMIAFFEALPPCLVGMEACATSHHWARELRKLGHDVRLMPAKDVKAYVKRNKNDAADAEAICEAVRRPTMRFVTVKTVEQQGRLMQHRVATS